MLAGPLAGAVAVVTGAAGGIGLASARKLSHLGARVALLDLDAERLDLQGQQSASITLQLRPRPDKPNNIPPVDGLTI